MKSYINYRYTLMIGSAILLMFAASCKKYVDLETPVNAVGKDEAFADSSTATSVILGLYGGLVGSNQTGQTANTAGFFATVLGAMSADDAYHLTSTTWDPVKNNVLTANAASFSGSIWPALYARIARTNYAIEGVTASTTLSTSVKNRLIGEAKFMRAWCYFYLVSFYSEVPLVLSTDALNTSLLPRATVVQVYEQILQDLTEAKNLLTTTYPSNERARANKNVVSAFLARVYFYQQNWPAAEAEATNVIGNASYSLVTNINNVFLNNSNETIWQISLAAATTPQTVFGQEFIPAGTTPTYVLYDTLAKTFEPGDKRDTAWKKPITYLSKTYYYPYKYKVKSTTTGNEYPVMIRLAEMYLIRAEARAQQNNISGAQSDLNAIRTRAGLPNTTATTQAQLLSALEHERWVELFTEWSDRWFNLRRLNKSTAVLSLIKPAWQPHQQLYPIASSFMTSNPNLTQNPGY